MLFGAKLQQLIDVFVDDYSVEENFSPATKKNKKNGMIRFMNFLGETPLSDQSIRAYLRYLRNTPTKKGTPREESTIDSEMKLVTALVHWLEREKHLPIGEITNLPKVTVHRKLKKFVSEEVAMKIILAGCKPSKFDNRYAKIAKLENAVFLPLLLKAGLRYNEASRIRGSDFNFDAEIPHVIIRGKGGNEEMATLPLDMIDELRKRKDKEIAFDVEEKSSRRIIRRGCIALGLNPDTKPHSLRQIFSLGRLRRGNPTQLVSRALRHRKVSITDEYYSHYLIEDVAPVVNDSPIITKNLPPEWIIDKVVKAVEGTGIAANENCNINELRKIERQEEIELVIRVTVKKRIQNKSTYSH